MLGRFKKGKAFSYRCPICSETHQGGPRFTYNEPPYALELSDEARARQLIIMPHVYQLLDARGSEYPPLQAIHANLDIPIQGSRDVIRFGTWMVVNEEDFIRYKRTYGTDQSDIACFGQMPVFTPYYDRVPPNQPYEHLRVRSDWGDHREYPSIEILECDHLLYRHQQEGVSWDEAITIASKTLHPENP